MPGKAPPSWPAEKPYEHLPTVEKLHEQSGVKISRLRLLLRAVPKWRCKDSTVRYDPTAAAAALEDLEDLEDDDDDDAPPPPPPPEPLPADPTQAAIVLHQRATSMALATLQRTLTLQNDVIKAMGDPLKMGMALSKQAQRVLQNRLGKYDEQWDRMVLITEELQNSQAEREAAAKRNENRTHMQREAFDAAKKYLPDALQKFQLTVEAGYAVDLARSIEPEHLEAFLGLGVLPPEKRATGEKLLALMKERKKAANTNAAKEGSNGKPPEPATASAAEPAAAPAQKEPATAEPAAAPATEVRPNGAADAPAAA